MPTSIEISEKAGVRYLHFSAEWIQGAMRIRKPDALELAYTRDMMACLLLREPPWPQEVLMVGLGAGSLAKFVYRQLPETRITVVEIDPQIEIIARLHFKLPDDPRRLHIIIGDGADYMRQSGPAFDAIFVDGFDKHGRAGVLDTLPFYQACRARLTANGLLSVNLLGRSRGFAASTQRIAEAFDGRALVFPSCDSGNAIAFGAGEEAVNVHLSEMSERARQLKAGAGIDLFPLLPRLQAAGKLVQERLRIG